MIFLGRNKVTQPYSSRHGGIDIVGMDHDCVLAAAEGTVEMISRWDGHTKTGTQSYGNLVVISDGNYRYYYAHLKTIDVKKGDRVYKSQCIGLMGSTGNSTGPHCHFEMRTGKTTSTRINPAAFAGVDNKKGIYSDTVQRTHTVKKGDTLWGISRKYLGSGVRYHEIMKLNNLKSDIIHVGDVLKIPET